MIEKIHASILSFKQRIKLRINMRYLHSLNRTNQRLTDSDIVVNPVCHAKRMPIATIDKKQMMWGARNASSAEFTVAKTLALAGCGLAAIMLFGGFFVVAETFFELWRSDAMRGPVLDSAFRYLGSILLIALFISSAEPE